MHTHIDEKTREDVRSMLVHNKRKTANKGQGKEDRKRRHSGYKEKGSALEDVLKEEDVLCHRRRKRKLATETAQCNLTPPF